MHLVESIHEPSADNELRISRVFDAPRELVWRAMTDPKHVVNWWGPTGFTTTIEVMDVRPGGAWRHVMHGPDGTDYPNRTTFTEVVAPKRLVFSNNDGKEGGISFVATWSFEALEPKKTKLTIHMVFPNAEARDFVVDKHSAIEGGKQTLGRLATYLPTMPSA